MRPSEFKKQLGRERMTLGAGITVIAWGGLLFFWLLRDGIAPRSGLALALIAGALAGPGLIIVGLVMFLANIAAKPGSELSVRVLKGIGEGLIKLLPRTGLRIGRSGEKAPRVGEEYDYEDCWQIVWKKGEFWLKYLRGRVMIRLNGEPAPDFVKLKPGDQIEMLDLLLIFDYVDSNQKR